MKILYWFLVVLLGFGSGYFLINYLTVHPLQMSFYLVLTMLCLFLLVVIIAARFRGLALALAIVLALATFIGGYFYQANVVLSREDTRYVPEITRPKGDLGLGHTAVIYFTHGEPETYNPIGWLNQFREFDEQGIAICPGGCQTHVYLSAAASIPEGRNEPPCPDAPADGQGAGKYNPPARVPGC